MDCEPGVQAAAEWCTASARPDAAQGLLLDTYVGRGKELTGSAGLSTYLLELESRVEALQHSAEVHSPATTSPVWLSESLYF